MSQPQTTAHSRPGRSASRADGARSRQRILDAAERLFADRGFAGTGIAAISAGSGLPASSIYWHFENKEDLAAATVERATERWIDALQASDPGADATSEELLSWISRRVEEMGRELPFFMRLSLLLGLELGHRDPALLERLRRGRDRARAHVRGTLDRLFAVEGIEVQPDQAEEIARLTMAFSEGAFVSRLFDPAGIDVERLSDDLESAMRAITETRRAGART